jgi:hypothetical protein
MILSFPSSLPRRSPEGRRREPESLPLGDLCVFARESPRQKPSPSPLAPTPSAWQALRENSPAEAESHRAAAPKRIPPSLSRGPDFHPIKMISPLNDFAFPCRRRVPLAFFASLRENLPGRSRVSPPWRPRLLRGKLCARISPVDDEQRDTTRSGDGRGPSPAKVPAISFSLASPNGL